MEFLVYLVVGAILGWAFVEVPYLPILFTVIALLPINFSKRNKELFLPGAAEYVINSCWMLLIGFWIVFLAVKTPQPW